MACSQTGGSSEPFFIVNLDVLLIFDDAQSTHTVSLSGATVTTHTIDKKYLPIGMQLSAVDGEIYLGQDNKTYILSDGLVFDSLLNKRVLLLGNICCINITLGNTVPVYHYSISYLTDSGDIFFATVYLLLRDGTYTNTTQHIKLI